MTKAPKASPKPSATKGSPAAKVVRDEKTGQFVTVKGFGALKNSDLKIKRGIDLLKPIAYQALARRPKKRKTG